MESTSKKVHVINATILVSYDMYSCWTCSTVTMQAQKEAPPDLICSDKFLIQSTIVPDGATEDYIISTTVRILKCWFDSELWR
ncbi:putative vesicle-associated membrane-protein-associated protein [Helianthus annuus]|nr:putative vesicle-associated membrane-protein-associated protein [Helianthus annuus]